MVGVEVVEPGQHAAGVSSSLGEAGSSAGTQAEWKSIQMKTREVKTQMSQTVESI